MRPPREGSPRRLGAGGGDCERGPFPGAGSVRGGEVQAFSAAFPGWGLTEETGGGDGSACLAMRGSETPPAGPPPQPYPPPSASGLCLSQPSFPVASLRSLKKKIIYIYAPKLESEAVEGGVVVVGGKGFSEERERGGGRAAERLPAPLALPPCCSAGARLPPGVRKGGVRR